MKSSTLPDIKYQFSEWYNEVVYKAELADHSPVKGSIVIRPYGWSLWEGIKEKLDKKIKDTGHQNASFPLLIPKSFLEREADHVEGFSPELAVVTYAGGKELEEPLVIRPTSETIIHYMFAQWLKSWRDLPFKINQWANVVRWEMRTRPFLRTTEFFWQEGHTAHETQQEAQAEAELMWREYIDLYQNYLAIPVVGGYKSEHEKFAGANRTYTVEGLMQDGKALQMCTSHLISQNFAKSFDMQFQDRDGNLAYPYLTSWGFTTRSIGAIVMMHGDQKGLIMPPRIAPIQVVIVPIFNKHMDKSLLLEKVKAIAHILEKTCRIHIDERDYESPGSKFYEWELKGVPLRIEIGSRDLEHNEAVVTQRINGFKESISLDELYGYIKESLDTLHHDLFKRAETFLVKHWHKIAYLNDFAQMLESQGGFYQTGWCKDHACEAQLKDHKATIRCILDNKKEFMHCFLCKKAAVCDILIARAY